MPAGTLNSLPGKSKHETTIFNWSLSMYIRLHAAHTNIEVRTGVMVCMCVRVHVYVYLFTYGMYK